MGGHIMPDRFLDIIGRFQNGDTDNMTHRELLMAMVYYQSLVDKKQDQMIEEIKKLQEYNKSQDHETKNLEKIVKLQDDKITGLEHKLEIEIVKDQQKTKLIAWAAAILGGILTLIKIWDYLSAKLGMIIYKSGIWGM